MGGERRFVSSKTGDCIRLYGESFYWFQDARVANLCYRVDDPRSTSVVAPDLYI